METVSPTGKVLSTFGSPNIECNGVRTGLGHPVHLPGPGRPGRRRDHLHGRPALHHGGDVARRACSRARPRSGGNLAFGGRNFALVGSTFYFQSGPPFNGAADAISSFSLASAAGLPRRAIQAPSDTLGWGAGVTTPATGNYFAPGTTPVVDATFDPWWAPQAQPPASWPTRSRTTPP